MKKPGEPDGDAINKKEVSSFKKVKPDVRIKLDYLRG